MKEKENKAPGGKKAGKIINIVVNILLVFAIILAFVCTYTSYVTKKGSGVPSLLGYMPLAIQSDSMKGVFEEGDLVISKAVEDPGKLEKGQIITFWTIINGQRVLNTHRIEQINDGGTYTYYTTKGDYNTIVDTLTVHESEVVGVYCTHIKGLGKVLDFLQTSQGFFLIVVLPVFVFFAYYVVEFFRALFAYQAKKTQEKLEKEQESKNDGMIHMSEEQLQQMLAKALLEANKQTAKAPEEAAAEVAAEAPAAELLTAPSSEAALDEAPQES